MNQSIYDMQEGDLARAVVGKRVTEVDVTSSTITLDDGTSLIFRDTADCCAWFSAGLRLGTLTENAVTSVVREERPGPDTRGLDTTPEAWTLHILAVDTTIASVDIKGDSTSGYYCHSVTLSVTTAEVAQ